VHALRLRVEPSFGTDVLGKPHNVPLSILLAVDYYTLRETLEVWARKKTD
jgi:hypothetical protein